MSRATAIGLAACAALAAVPLAAQEGTQCNFESNHPVIVLTQPSGQRNAFTGGGVLVRCPERQIVLRADSMELYGDERRFFLVGNVDYSEPRLKLTSDQLT